MTWDISGFLYFDCGNIFKNCHYLNSSIKFLQQTPLPRPLKDKDERLFENINFFKLDNLMSWFKKKLEPVSSWWFFNVLYV